MAFLPPIGISDFRRIRRDGLTYVDKTSFVQRLLAIPSAAFLVPRPRRFGKTLNLSTARCFLEKRTEDFSSLFEGLQIWDDAAARPHFQRYPVIFLSFKDVKYPTWPECLASIAHQVSAACGEHLEILPHLPVHQRGVLEPLIHRTASLADLAEVLRLLTDALATHHGQPVVLLIDEYDTPIHSGYVHGYYDEVVGFFRNFLSAGLKDNPHLFKGVITGILRIAKENLFSGLNNIQVFGLTEERFSTDFGFTEAEVVELARQAEALAHLDVMRTWYNGYRFADAVIYNPWSILMFLGDPQHKVQAHWVSTSSNDLLREVLVRGGFNHPADLEVLLAGGSVRTTIEDSIILRDIHRRPAAVWSLLHSSGYLTGSDSEKVLGGNDITLRVPNREVFDSYHLALRDWLDQATQVGSISDLTRALLTGDAEVFAEMLSEIIKQVMSFNDFGPRTSERVYQAFLAGLLVAVQATHSVRSNRESGFGRYDVALIPKKLGQSGVVMELKVPRSKESVEQALDSAARQIVDRDYATELRALGATPIHGFAVVFDGKEVHVRTIEV
jgi:hypothetical protein